MDIQLTLKFDWTGALRAFGVVILGVRHSDVASPGKRAAERATVDLVDEDEEEEEHTRQCARWTRDEEILLTEYWIETSEIGQIGEDRSDDSFWGQIIDDFNNRTTQGYRTRNMLTSKWSRINAQQPKGRKFQLEHAWRILKGHSKWDAPEPLDTEDHTEIFGPDTRPRPDLRRKLQAGTSAYEAKKQKESATMEFKEMEFLTIDADQLSEPKTSIIRRRQEIIIAKYVH
ncbi:hypothetical protein Tco_0745198 [Tanacetum coccineum]